MTTIRFKSEEEASVRGDGKVLGTIIVMTVPLDQIRLRYANTTYSPDSKSSETFAVVFAQTGDKMYIDRQTYDAIEGVIQRVDTNGLIDLTDPQVLKEYSPTSN